MTSHSRDFGSLRSSRSPTSPGASCPMRRERSCSPSLRHGACRSPTMGDTSRKNFSSSSFTGYGHRAYPKVSVNKRLLAPLHLDIDPSFQEIRTKEKEEMKTLNNQFAALIGKVQSLERHNQVLLTRWNFLKEQDQSLSDLDIKLLYDQYMNKLSREARSIDVEKEQLDSELDEVLEAMDAFRNKYEEEINKRTGMEFTFTALKKDLDNCFLHKTELEAKLSGLQAWVELMKNIQEEELEEAMSQIKDVSVVLGIDNNRYNPDPQKIVEEVRAQYEALAIRSWEELEALTRSKLNEREALSARFGDHLLNDRRVIAELNIQIQKMRSCIVSLKSQCLHLENNIKEAGTQGETALSDAKAKLAKLEEALHNARQDLAQLVKEYQELMNIKLALDLEILTYRTLMEGEESCMESPSPAVISRIYSTQRLSSPDSSITSTSNVTTRAKEDLIDKTRHSRSSFETGLSRNQSTGSRGVSGGDFARSHSNKSRGCSDSSPSRHSSSRSGIFADNENSSGSHGHGSGSDRRQSSRNENNLEGSLSGSPRGGIRGISKDNLSRTQSNRSDGLTDSVFTRTHSGASDGAQEGTYSRSQSYRSVGRSPTSFSRTHSGESNSVPKTTHSRDHTSESRHVLESNLTRSQTSRSGGLTDSVFSRTHSGVSESGLSRSYSGTSASYVEGDLCRSQTDGNDFQGSPGSRGSEGCAQPYFSRTRSAEDGGVPVGGISRSHSGASRDISVGSPSGSQSDKDESYGSPGSEGCAQPYFSRTRSAEDGGVPVGGISRSHSGASRDISVGSPSGSQSDKDESYGSRGSEGYAQSNLSRTRSAEDGGVPVGGISRSHSGASRDISVGSLSGSQSDKDESYSSPGSEGCAQPYFSGTRSAEDGGVPVGGFSSSTNSMSTRNNSEGGFSRSQRGQSGGFANAVFSRSSAEAKQEHSLSRSSSGTNSAIRDGGEPSGGHSPRSEKFSQSDLSQHHGGESRVDLASSPTGHQIGGSKCFSESHLSRSQSNRSGSLADSIFARTHSGTSEGGLSRSQNYENEGLLEARASGTHSHGGGGPIEPSVSRSHSAESKGVPESVLSRSHSGGSRGVLEGSLSRSQSTRSEEFVHGGLSRDHSYENKESRSDASRRLVADDHSAIQSEGNEVVLESGLSRHTGGTGVSVSRGQSGESGSPVDTSTPICLHKRNEAAVEHSLSRSQSGESGSFKAADFYRSSSEESRGMSEASLSRSCSKENEHLPEGTLSRNYSYKCAVASHPNLPRTKSNEAEDSLSRSHSSGSGSFSQPGIYRSQSDEREKLSEVGLSRNYSEESPVDNLCMSHSGRQEAFPESVLYRSPSGGVEDSGDRVCMSRHSGNEGLPGDIVYVNYGYQFVDASHPDLPNTTNEGVWESGQCGEFVEGSISRTYSGEPAEPGPACLIYEVCSDGYPHPPAGEICYIVESTPME